MKKAQNTTFTYEYAAFKTFSGNQVLLSLKNKKSEAILKQSEIYVFNFSFPIHDDGEFFNPWMPF